MLTSLWLASVLWQLPVDYKQVFTEQAFLGQPFAWALAQPKINDAPVFVDYLKLDEKTLVNSAAYPTTSNVPFGDRTSPDFRNFIYNPTPLVSNPAPPSFMRPVTAATTNIEAARTLPTITVPLTSLATTTNSLAPSKLLITANQPFEGNSRALPPAAGKVGKNTTAPVLGLELMVFFNAGADPSAIAKSLGLNSSGPINAEAANIWIFRAADASAASRARATLSDLPSVQSAHQLGVNATGKPRAFSPNDPFFFPGSNPAIGGPGDTLSTTFPGQWHLVNNMPNGAGASGNVNTISVNITGAWNNDYTGVNINIGIVEDSVQVSHPDLSPNAIAALHRHFGTIGNDLGTNPNPPGAGANGNHGTAVAGVAGARGNNGIGVTGAAPFAGLVGIRTDDYNVPAVVASYAHANGINPLNSIQVKNHSYGPTSPYDTSWSPTLTAIRNSALAGTVNVIAAGNDRGDEFNEDSNKAFPQNSPHAITIGALGNNGIFADYTFTNVNNQVIPAGSSFGANLFVVAPSSSNSTTFPGITTTDRVGNVGYNTSGASNYAAGSGGNTGLSYTNEFGGTSSASPLAAGVIAVALSSNPALLSNNMATEQNTTRVIKHLLARTSTVVNPTDSTIASDPVGGVGWRTNAGGFRFNQNYGFGLINATALTQQAQLFSGVTPLTTANSGTITVNTAIPDNDVTGLTRTVVFNVPPATLQPIEEVVVTLSFSHTFPGDITAFLTSPSGYRSRVMIEAFGNGGVLGVDNINWQYTLNSFWGENPNGTWTLNLADVFAADTGTFNSFSIEVRMGTLVPVPEPTSIMVCGCVVLAGWRLRRRFVKIATTTAADVAI